jgi:hypothetical protein
MPQTWRGTYNGDRDRQRLEAKHPELAGDQRPIIAHEGAGAELVVDEGPHAGGLSRYWASPLPNDQSASPFSVRATSRLRGSTPAAAACFARAP